MIFLVTQCDSFPLVDTVGKLSELRKYPEQIL